MNSGRRVLLSWSSGKDSAWTLHRLRNASDVEVVALLTTFNEDADRVAMHAVPRSLLEAQAAAAGLPLWPVDLPWPCSNQDYEERMAAALERARLESITHIAFGDVFLEDVRAYRERLLAGTGIDPLFPIWASPEETADLARDILSEGFRAVLTCVDLERLPGSYSGRDFDLQLLEELPAEIDPCGERGEFHTFCFDGPIFSEPISFHLHGTLSRDGYCYANLGRGDDDGAENE